ncbi:restriction endonuclease subunit S [Escherichia fergusonii]|uniref:Specificity determinant for hsdM and hsdR (Modular protein) n=1 Tax=Escherichia fergusonii (strain ATCC 35469 / DSM 13698 / CCUG 18766 / IAM 14443 / JCM 21226 / LMG 7866 / NBRC 102419 / NCTC 12128 / CDC 0568-73) TaxID=585054 RepID=B7LQL4_ESCF3|nr:restriction endonuclease subunit S [Escherichia fergusonii]EIH2135617.1 restriction endonuclease subunit S [Escherichia fergusonii]EIH2155162.1 restriction endonuclease subunit S [Escherichia fergusonii]EIH9409041.1 restriction endonuclease subunit S [Escherichia fergusonii]EIH9432124.1 restriction endonuclease subunit S [Escherichia fergusonii]QQC70410.1 restriction endonuclease subunit S [Escherichia fergusonii]
MSAGKLPEGWVETNLQNVASWGSGGTPSRNHDEYYNGNIPWIKTGDLGPKIITNASEYITDAGVQNSSAKFFPKGSVAIAMYGATIGKTSILGIDATTNQACAVGTPLEGITSTLFLYYFLLNEKNAFIKKGKGGAQPNISQTVIKEHIIYLPPLAEQKIITEKLDTLLAQVDSTKARLEQIPQILKRFRQAVLERAVNGKLTECWRDCVGELTSAEEIITEIKKYRKASLSTEGSSASTESKRQIAKIEKHCFKVPKINLPKGWVWTTFLQSMEKVVDCHNKTAPYVDQGIHLIRTPDIRNGVISLDNTKYIDNDTYLYWSKRCPPRSGDIIFTREAPMGEAGIVPENTIICMGQRMMLLRPIPEYIHNKYVLLNILSSSFQTRMISQAIGTGVKHLRVADVESLTYPLPPIEEQHEIVRRVEQLFAYADTIEKQVNNALARVNNLTQSILAKAFRGELTAQWRAENPDLISGENSAAALLEKIKAERAASGGKKASRKKS